MNWKKDAAESVDILRQKYGQDGEEDLLVSEHFEHGNVFHFYQVVAVGWRSHSFFRGRDGRWVHDVLNDRRGCCGLCFGGAR